MLLPPTSQYDSTRLHSNSLVLQHSRLALLHLAVQSGSVLWNEDNKVILISLPFWHFIDFPLFSRIPSSIRTKEKRRSKREAEQSEKKKKNERKGETLVRGFIRGSKYKGRLLRKPTLFLREARQIRKRLEYEPTVANLSLFCNRCDPGNTEIVRMGKKRMKER